MKQRRLTLRLAALLVGAAALAAAPPACADLAVFATVPEWAALAQRIGGDQVKVFSATQALQDPHRVEARPSLIARLRNARLVVATGADLEIGWLPLALRESANRDVLPGQPGYFEASRHVRMLDVPARLDRADGDVHAAGNPHVQTDARNFLPIADALAKRMAELDAPNAARYQEGLRTFTEQWRASLARWEAQAAPLRGKAVVSHHRSFTYLYDWLGLKEVGTLEPKPGVEPSVAWLGELAGKVAASNPRAVIRATYNPARAADWFAQKAGVPAVVLPFTVGGSDKAGDLTGLFDDTIARLAAAIR